MGTAETPAAPISGLIFPCVSLHSNLPSSTPHAVATLNASKQALAGTILVGSDSTLTLNLTDGSVLIGTISGSITNAKGSVVSTQVGTVHVSLDGTSTWTLTADTYVTSFTGDASQVIANGYTLYVNGVALTGTK